MKIVCKEACEGFHEEGCFCFSSLYSLNGTEGTGGQVFDLFLNTIELCNNYELDSTGAVEVWALLVSRFSQNYATC